MCKLQIMYLMKFKCKRYQGAPTFLFTPLS